jgi:hypothetical protein
VFGVRRELRRSAACAIATGSTTAGACATARARPPAGVRASDRRPAGASARADADAAASACAEAPAAGPSRERRAVARRSMSAAGNAAKASRRRSVDLAPASRALRGCLMRLVVLAVLALIALFGVITLLGGSLLRLFGGY